jgi:hypothetical protein
MSAASSVTPGAGRDVAAVYPFRSPGGGGAGQGAHASWNSRQSLLARDDLDRLSRTPVTTLMRSTAVAPPLLLAALKQRGNRDGAAPILRPHVWSVRRGPILSKGASGTVYLGLEVRHGCGRGGGGRTRKGEGEARVHLLCAYLGHVHARRS